MGQRPLKPCKYLGCKVLHRNEGLYCDDHKDIMETRQREEKNKRRQARNRQFGYVLSDEEKFYSSMIWQRKRALTKERQGFFCLNCLDNQFYKECTQVHHIIEILEDWSMRLDDDNLICLCSECHQGVHILYRRSEIDRLKTQAELRRILKTYNEGGYKIGRS